MIDIGAEDLRVVAGAGGDEGTRRLGIGRGVEVGSDVLGVAGVAVPAFAVVLPYELPVRSDRVVDLVGHAGAVFQPLGGERRGELGVGVSHRLGLGAAPDEDQAADLVHRRRR